jgi:hypothetical protein
MARKKIGTRNRVRRGSQKPTVQQLRRNVLTPEMNQRPEERSRIRTAMRREVANDLTGIIQAPARSDPRPVGRIAPTQPASALRGSPGPSRRTPSKKTTPPKMVGKTAGPTKVSPTLEQAKTCKTRPARNAGNGNSRAFVPWCHK